MGRVMAGAAEPRASCMWKKKPSCTSTALRQDSTGPVGCQKASGTCKGRTAGSPGFSNLPQAFLHSQK